MVKSGQPRKLSPQTTEISSSNTIKGVVRKSNIWVFPKIGGKPPKSCILRGFSIINHPFWGTIIFGNTHIYSKYLHDVLLVFLLEAIIANYPGKKSPCNNSGVSIQSAHFPPTIMVHWKMNLHKTFSTYIIGESWYYSQVKRIADDLMPKLRFPSPQRETKVELNYPLETSRRYPKWQKYFKPQIHFPNHLFWYLYMLNFRGVSNVNFGLVGKPSDRGHDITNPNKALWSKNLSKWPYQ